MDPIEEIKQKLMPIFRKEPISKVILFGSYAKGCQTALRDVDLAIDSNGHLLGLDFFRVLDEIVQALKKEVDLFEVAEIVQASPMGKAVLYEGIILYERQIA